MKIKSFVLRMALSVTVLAASAFLTRPAYADDVIFTVSPASFAMAEGSSVTLTYTATNVSTSDQIQVTSLASGVGFLSGDSTDHPTFAVPSPAPLPKLGPRTIPSVKQTRIPAHGSVSATLIIASSRRLGGPVVSRFSKR